MRLVVVQETDWLKRGPHQQHHLFERLSLRGHHVTVLDYPILREHWPHEPLWAGTAECSGQRIYDGAEIQLITPGTVSWAPLARPSSMWSHQKQLQALIKDARPDVIVSYALSTGMPALKLAQRHNIPFVFHVIDALHAIVPGAALQKIAYRFEKYILKHATQSVFINEHLKDYAVRLGAPEDKTCVLRTGVTLERFGQSAQRDEVRATLGIQPDDFILFFMGWLYDFAGLEAVASGLKDAPENVRLLIVGDGDAYSSLVDLRDNIFEERMILTGRVPYEQIPELLSAADVLLLPFETVPATEHIVPIKLYEYMASRKPVISTPLPGVQRDIGFENGVVYAPAREHVQMALKLKDAGQLDTLGEKARGFTEEYCDWNIITEAFEALLEQVST